MEFLIIVIGIIVDRITKLWAIQGLKINGDKEIIKDIFSFSYLENRGAAFGIFQNKVVMLTIVTIVIIVLMLLYLYKYRDSSKMMRISMALIISGAIGNLIDRIYYRYVVDFIQLHYKDVYYFPTFNVADMFVVIGTIFLVISILKDDFK